MLRDYPEQVTAAIDVINVYKSVFKVITSEETQKKWLNVIDRKKEPPNDDKWTNV